MKKLIFLILFFPVLLFAQNPRVFSGKCAISQTGGASGTTRGLYVNPTITAASSWRSIETSNNTGWAFYAAGKAQSYYGGNVLNQARHQTKKGADVASANDLTLGGDGNVFSITGTTQINAITTTNWQAGSEITLLFASTPTVKNNTAGGANTASMLLAGGADFSATANDVLKLVYDGSRWLEVSRSVN